MTRYLELSSSHLPSWGPLGPILGQSWGHLSFAILGHLGVILGPQVEPKIFKNLWFSHGCCTCSLLKPSWAIIRVMYENTKKKNIGKSMILAPRWAAWAPLGAILGPPWAVLGPSWGRFGPSWGYLERFWNHLGTILALRWV